MPYRIEQIRAFREILKLAKTDLYINSKLNRALSSDVMDALSLIGKEKIYELAPEVYELLDSPNEVIRETVVTTLGSATCLHISEFKNTAYKIWLEDPDEMVRELALRAWASYYHATGNREVLKILYKVLVDESYPIDHRCTAMEDIFFVVGKLPEFYNPYYQSRDFYMLTSHDEFNKKIDWDEIRAIMNKYVPSALS